MLAWQLVDHVAEVNGRANTYALDFRYCAQGADPDRLIALFDGIRLQPYL